MLEQLASEFHPILAERELRWSLNIAPDSMLVGDADKLARAFDNLIRNAVNYSYAGTETGLKFCFNSIFTFSLASSDISPFCFIPSNI